MRLIADLWYRRKINDLENTAADTSQNEVQRENRPNKEEECPGSQRLWSDSNGLRYV